MEIKKIEKGFDRDIDFKTIKEKLLFELNSTYQRLLIAEKETEKKILINKICYLMISIIQLRMGSRISEACEAFKLFIENNNIEKKQIVKIAKSEGMKYNHKTKKKFFAKARYRKMQFPDWINKEIFEEIKLSPYVTSLLNSNRLKKRVLDFLLKNFDCNTHSLRYAFINYMLYEEKRPMNDVAKFVGHSTVSQLVTYTQIKNTDQIFDLKI